MALLSITEARRYIKPKQASDDQLVQIMELVEEFVWIICEPIITTTK
ncbi:MAG: hypothetical protein IKO56_09985 [Alphaproteobacteria bacterium]|nr:hypothetical protein [Alphaproteobacteria bacterium]